MATESLHTEGVRHEVRDVNVPALTVFAGVIALTVAAALLFCWLLFRFFAHEMPIGPRAAPYTSARQVPPEPRLQPSPRLDLEEYLDVQRKELTTYGWVDRQRGIVRIPIARAMQLLLKQGLPVRTGAQALRTGQTADGYRPPAAHAEAARNPAQHRTGQIGVTSGRNP